MQMTEVGPSCTAGALISRCTTCDAGARSDCRATVAAASVATRAIASGLLRGGGGAAAALAGRGPCVERGSLAKAAGRQRFGDAGLH